MQAPEAAPPVVVLDAGHGGTQTGARGVCDVWEKDVTLPIVLRTAEVLEASGLVHAGLTRTADVHVPLERRGQLANQLGARLFVSVHANASPAPQARGIETFFLSLGASSRRLTRLVQRENEGVTQRRLAARDPLQRVLTALQFDATHDESQRLAIRMQRSLLAQMGGRGRGVLQAPFAVLMGAKMPATLVEVGFLTHPTECARLVDARGQDAVAQGLAAGILAYLAESQQLQAPAPVARAPSP